MKNSIYTIEEIKILTKAIFEKYKIKKAYLFGSYARGEAKSNSDIYIIIEETYTEEIDSENKYGKLAKELFYKQVIMDRRVL